ncbi:MAG: hypothetical protein JO257_02740 [Deltaproteobacteria bacterium]|nr:hypothetical protein [Deltaproteobacteria bacterium]
MRIAIALVLWTGCSFSARGAPTDARDSGGGGSDAAIATGRQQMEIVAGAGRVTAGTKTIDIEVGHAVLVRKSSVGTITITGAQVVQP